MMDQGEGIKDMNEKLLQFAQQTRQLLSTKPGVEARQDVAALLSQLLHDKAFVSNIFAQPMPDRHILYEDEELHFCILAHQYEGARTSPPHDHAHCWAIYGQVEGETHMRDYKVLSAPNEDQPGIVQLTKSYHLAPGDVHVYEPGDVHSPERHASTKLIRIEEQNMEKVQRFPFIEDAH